MIVGIVQARMGSSRLPRKVLADVNGEPMLARQLERIARSQCLERIAVATTTAAADDAIADLGAGLGVAVHRGADADVLDRFCGAARAMQATHIVRLTADCPLSDPAVIDDVVGAHLKSGDDLTANVVERTFPDGLDVEVIAADALYRADCEASSSHDREHVTPYLYRPANAFRVGSVVAPRDLGALRWTVDYAEDLAFVRAVFAAFAGREAAFSWHEVLALLEAEPAIAAINAARSPAHAVSGA
jgi:spore coat polysaccharide biosynthesis protein SpsF